MLKRKIYNTIASKIKEKKAILVAGARQIGKTFIIREFCKSNYEVFVEINFITMPEYKKIFDGNLDANTIITNITAIMRKRLIPDKTIIFFDEVQECPNARVAIKFLVEDGRFDYIESGSLLGINYKEVLSYPVGYETYIDMYPLDFYEFICAMGVQEETIKLLKKHLIEMKEVPSVIHENMINLYRLYIAIGGMPEVVDTYIKTNDIKSVLNLQRNICRAYRQDITKYSKNDKNKIHYIYDAIPSELNAQNKRFNLSSISKTARFERYEESMLWLKDAGVAIPCFSVAAPIVPLELNSARNLFKLYSNDTGLLIGMIKENVQKELILGDVGVNAGSILENSFASQFLAKGYDIYYYNNKKIGEIDFIVNHNNKIIPIEIKSGDNYKNHKALTNMINQKKWNIENVIIFSKFNIEKNEKYNYIPWYMILFDDFFATF